MDNHYLADKRLVVKAYTTPTDADVIVTALHTDYLNAEGVTIGSIQAGPELTEIVFNYVTVAQALDGLAGLTGFIWFIDEQKRLFFVDRATYPAPWPWSLTTPKPRGSIPKLSEGNPKYRNRQYIRGGTGIVDRVEVQNGDGVKKAFAMGFPLATAPTIAVAGLGAQTVGIKVIDTGKDWYWSQGDPIVEATVAPGNGTAVTVTYEGQYPLISMARNEGERLARQAIEGGTGIIEELTDEAYHDSIDSSLESASAKLLAYARDAQKFTYETTDRGIRPGQIQPVNNPLLGLNNVDMLIESVVMTSRGENLEVYNITAIVGPIGESWTKFFSTILRRQTEALRLGGEKLLVLFQETEDLVLAEVPSSWQQEKGQYCWAVKTNGARLRELWWDFGTWG